MPRMMDELSPENARKINALIAAGWLALEQMDECAPMFIGDEEFYGAREALGIALNDIGGHNG